jgi:hypothetical protein
VLRQPKQATLPLYQKGGVIRFACSSNWIASTAMSLRIRTPSGVGSPNLAPVYFAMSERRRRRQGAQQAGR